MSASHFHLGGQRVRVKSSHLVLGVLLVSIGLLIGAGNAFADEETHVFDPTLSLTGDCSVSVLDPVPDPGCPNPPSAPSQGLSGPHGVAIDAYGNEYVSDASGPASSTNGRIDVFDSSGNFITEVPSPEFPTSLAVDSQGVLYVTQLQKNAVRYAPTKYEPKSGEIVYGPGKVFIPNGLSESGAGVAINPENDHVFVAFFNSISEYSSAAEGNTLLDAGIGTPSAEFAGLSRNKSVAVDAAHQRIYASSENAEHQSVVEVFELTAPHKRVLTIDGSSTPAKKFFSVLGDLSLTADENTGHVFVDDIEKKRRVYEFNESGGYVGKIEHGFEYVNPQSIAYANGAENPNQGYLYVPTGEVECCHVFAFEPKQEAKAPVVESVSFSAVSASEATLEASIVPNAAETKYAFEYTTQEAFEAEGFAGATRFGEGELGGGKIAVDVTAPLSGLAAGASYRVRVTAENVGGTDEGEVGFATFPEYQEAGACSNVGLRVGASAALPDCRAYELVTPANTNGHKVYTPGHVFAGQRLPTPSASAEGESLAFLTLGGTIPGFEGAGAFNGDGYVATRTAGGWQTASAGPNGGQTSNPLSGGLSPEHGFSIWTAKEAGILPIEGKETDYVRYPDGSFHLLGEGSLGVARLSEAKFLGDGGAHIVFTTLGLNQPPVQLEPDAPPSPTVALYDRTLDGVTHVVSLLPGDVTPSENATYRGANFAGTAVAFTIGSTLYLRLDDSETVEVAAGNPTFAGISGNGGRVFYREGGNLFAFDVEGAVTTQITTSANATVVNVSPDGSHAYFVSPSVLTGEGNPRGEEAQLGASNLYSWDGSSTSFIGSVTETDVKGEKSKTGGADFGGLGLWVGGLASGSTIDDPSRTSADGKALLFESHANLTGYDPGGHREVYRYLATEEGTALDCLSCPPTGAPAGSDAHLASVGLEFYEDPISDYALIPNLAANGRRAFFESSDPLVAADNDGVQDVYEWEAQGEGSCETPGGCISLISSGQSAHPNYLFGVSKSGNDAFVFTSDLLLPSDPDETPSVYDVRVNGGFSPPPSTAGECLGEACQPAAVAPNDPTPASSSFEGAGNVREEATEARCPKGKRKVRRAGKSRCAPARKHHKHSIRNKSANSNGRASR